MNSIEDIKDSIRVVEERMRKNAETLSNSTDSISNSALTNQMQSDSELLTTLKQKLIKGQ